MTTVTTSSLEHLSYLDSLLEMEYDYERAAYNRSLSADNISGRVCEADCKYPIAIGNHNYNALNKLILTVTYESEDDILENSFEPGQPVTFFHLSKDTSAIVELSHSCFVDSFEEGIIRVAIPNRSALHSIEDTALHYAIGIRTAIDNTTYRVMHESIRKVINTGNEKLIHLRETLIGNLPPRFHALPHIYIPWLNSSQNSAVCRSIAAQDVAIVHGPPGTGKTTTLIEIILETLRRETHVLVCAPSNAAVDWISEQIYKRGINVLRVGNPLKMSDEMLACSYEQRYADHPDYHELWNIRRSLNDLSSSKSSTQNKTKIATLRRSMVALEKKINTELFEQASVVCCTLIGSAYQIMAHRHFGTVFIDEAAQALEPACWTAILKADRVVLCGDHQQLPPTVKCVEAARQGLSRTLMQHVAHNKPQCVCQLTTQYRMHRDIMAFSSKWFYNGQLQAAPEVADRLVHLMDTPLTWIDTINCGFGERQNKNLSRMNAEEARLVVHTVRDYINMIGLERIANDKIDFGIISPYRAQVRMIRRLLKMQPFYRRLGKQVSVNTVDGFQGQERDVIVISMVRDNDEGQIGFLNDLRRMNVAITRARMKLFVIGNSRTISNHRFYKQLFEHFQQHGQVTEIPASE